MTFQVKQAGGEVVATEDSYVQAIRTAEHLSKTTKVLHFVPVTLKQYASV